jgi:hypothetical protein
MIHKQRLEKKERIFFLILFSISVNIIPCAQPSRRLNQSKSILLYVHYNPTQWWEKMCFDKN